MTATIGPIARVLGRLLLSGVFVAGGLDAILNPEWPAKKASEELDVPKPKLSARVNGSAMVLAGAMLALGIRPRLGATVLAGSLVPTTLAGHPFWKEEDEEMRTIQQNHFLKNVALLGAALLVIADHPR